MRPERIRCGSWEKDTENGVVGSEQWMVSREQRPDNREQQNQRRTCRVSFRQVREAGRQRGAATECARTRRAHFAFARVGGLLGIRHYRLALTGLGLTWATKGRRRLKGVPESELPVHRE